MRARAAAAGLALALSAIGAHGAGKCDGDSASYRIMPPVIGRPEATARSPYDLPCDSMIVPRGQTTIIHGLSVVNFGPGSRQGGKIFVKGKLVVEGKPGNPVYLAGSIAANVIGFAPGDRPWIGIQADTGAILRISHARFYYASAGMILSSRDVILKSCFFKGTSALTLPDTKLALNPSGQSLSSLDLREGWLSIFSGGSKAKSSDGPADEPADEPAAVSTPVPAAVTTPVPATVTTPVPAAVTTPVPATVSTPEPAIVSTDIFTDVSTARSNPAGRKRNREQGARASKAWTWLAGSAGVLAISGATWWWVLRPVAQPNPNTTPAAGGIDAAPRLPEPGPAGP